MDGADMIVAALSAVGGGAITLWGASFKIGEWKSRVEEQLTSHKGQLETLMSVIAKTSVLEARLDTIVDRQQNIETAINEVRAMLFQMSQNHQGSGHKNG